MDVGVLRGGRASIAVALVVVLLLATLAGLLLAGSAAPGRGSGSVAAGSAGPGSPPRGSVHPAAPGIGSILSTIDPISDRTLPGDAGVSPELYPQYGLYDAANGQIYLRNSEDTEAAIGALSTTAGHMVADITTPGGAESEVITPTIANDSKTGYLYATNANNGEYPGNVSVIDTATDQVTGSITVGYNPDGIAYDPANNELYVANAGSRNVTVISGANNRSVASIPTPTDPSAILFDPISDQVFTANWVYPTGSVTVISTASNTAIANVTVGSYPLALALDTKDDYVDVLNQSTKGYDGVVTEVHAGSSPSVVGTLTVGEEPVALAYDPTNDYLYVANSPSTAYNNVSVFNQSSGHEVASILIGQGPAPQSIVFDPVGGDIYVSTYTTNNVSIINTATSKVLASVSTFRNGGLGPLGLVVDPVTGNVYTLNEGDELTAPTSTVISPSSHAAIDTIPLATYPRGITYEAAGNTLAVGNAGGNNTYFLNASTYAVTRETPAGRNPEFTAYDPATGTTYTLNPTSNNVTAINAAGAPIASIPVGVGIDVNSMDFNPFNGNLYIVSEIGNVTVINGTTNMHLAPIVLHASDPWGSVYDPHNHDVYVANYESKNVSVISSTDAVVRSIPVGNNPIYVTFDSENDTIWVTNAGSANITVINDTSQSTVHSVPLSTTPDVLQYDPANNAVYNDPGYPYEVVAYNASTYQELAGSPLVYTTVSSSAGAMGYDPATHDLLVFDLIMGAIFVIGSPSGSAPRYAVTFQESGLPVGTEWAATLNGSTMGSATSSIGFSLPNGTGYPFSIGAVSGYVANRTSGGVSVAGHSVTVEVAFFPPSSLFPVNFEESGLVAGTAWTVTLSGMANTSTTNTVGFMEPNGSDYSFVVGAVTGFASNLTSGVVSVAGEAQTVRISFTPFSASYLVTFTESGLPNGPTWYINVTGLADPSATVSGSSGTTISVELGNGSYRFSASTSWKNWTTTPTGSFSVSGAAKGISVPFTLQAYPITFTESGLPMGTSWWVTIGSVTNTTTAPGSNRFLEPNGSYSYTVGSSGSFAPSAPSGTVSVAGGAGTKQITFSATSTAPGSSGSSTSGTSPWVWIGLGLVLLLVVLLLVFLLARRRRKSPDTPAAPASAPLSPPPPATPPPPIVR